MKTVKRLLTLASNHIGTMILAAVGIVGASILNLATPALMREFVASLESDAFGMDVIAYFAIALIAAYLVRAVCRGITIGVAHIAAWRFVPELTLKVYDKLEQLSLRYYQDKQTGDLMSRITSDTRQLETFIAHSVPELIGNLVTVIGVCVMMFFINAELALITLIPVPLVLVGGWFGAKFVAPMYKVNSRVFGELNGVFQDNITGMKEIKAFGCEEREHKKITEDCRYYAKVNIRANLASSVFTPMIEFLTSVGTVFVIVFGGMMALEGNMAISDIVGFVMYLSLFYTPLSVLARLFEDMQAAAAGAERIFAVLDSVPEVADAEDAKELENCLGEVSFEKVSFHYNKEEPLLEDVSFTAKPGEMVALVGPTGVGKTTVVSLIERFYDPISGSVKIDGKDIRTLTQRSLRSQMSMVLQDVFLFNGTIAENIAYGLLSEDDMTDEYKHITTEKGGLHVNGIKEPLINVIRKNPETDRILSSSVSNIDMDKIKEAAKIAHAHEFIMSLPNGYDTLIGERGMRLSGGQKQRIAIARAVLRDTPILILDEATSAVDNTTEAEIQSAIESLTKSRTVIVIAHRLSTVMRADKIIVLEEGRIAECGRHEELINADGLYARLCRGAAQHERAEKEIFA